MIKSGTGKTGRINPGLAAVLAFGLLTGLWGLRWGLPGPERLRAFPERLLPSPEIARMFAERWARLYDDLRRSHEQMRAEEPITYVQGIEEIPPSWSLPPDKLLNSYRALLLQSENPDEKKSFIILSQMRPWKLDFKPLYAVYGGAYIYPLGAFLKALSWLGAVSLVPDMSHYLQKPSDMGRLYLGGRLFILLFHLGSLWVLYDIGRRLRGPSTGFFAAFFFALCPLVAANSHILKPHPYAAFWAFACLRSTLMAFENGRSRDYRLCGFFGGMAFGANFTLLFFAAMPALAWLGRVRLPEAGRELKQAAAGCALAALIFIASNPYFVFAHGEYAWEMNYASNGPGLRLSMLWTVIKRLATNGMGIILLTLGAMEIAAAFKGKERVARFLAWGFLACFATLLFLLSFRTGFMTFQHYYYPIVGWACVLSAIFLARLPGFAQAVTVGAVLLTSGVRSWAYLENMRLDGTPLSTRFEAARWIEEHVPQGSTLGLSRYPEPAHTPYFRYDRYHLLIFERVELLDAKRRPDYMVVDRNARSQVESLNDYELARAFEPVLARITADDENFFANAPMYVYKHRSASR